MTASRLKRRIAYWQKVLGLGSWEISLSEHPADEESLATTHTDGKTRQAALCFKPGTPDGQYDRLIVHELTHVLLMDCRIPFQEAVETRGAEARHILDQAYERGEEFACERLAMALTGIERVEFGYDVPAPWRHVSLVR